MVLQHARRLCLGQGSSGWGRHQQVLRLDVAVGGVGGVHRRERGQHLAQQVAQGLLTLDNPQHESAVLPPGRAASAELGVAAGRQRIPARRPGGTKPSSAGRPMARHAHTQVCWLFKRQ